MAVDMQQVRAALDPEEPDYPAAARLGADALPHLEILIGGADASLAAKAAYLAGLIGGERSAAAVAKAARSSQTTVRIAAAAAARHLGDADSEAVLDQLVDDADRGVQKVALRSVPAAASEGLRARVSAVSRTLADAPRKARPAKATKRPPKKRVKAKTVKKTVKKTAKKTGTGRKSTTSKRPRSR